MQKCLAHLESTRGFSKATTKNYGLTYSQFLAFLQQRGHKDEPASFNVNSTMDFCDWLAEKGAGSNTILNKLYGLSTLATYLMKRSDGRGKPLLLANPTKGFDRPEPVEPTTFFLFPDELRAFLAVKLPLYINLVRALLVDTGIRRIEAVEANVGDVQEIDGLVYLTVKVKGRRAKNAEPDSKPLSPEVAELVRDALLARGMPAPEEPLLTGFNGKRWTESALTCAFIRIGELAGITRMTTSPHRLRHTANVIARRAGIDALVRARMLGHRSLQTLKRYDHLVPGEVAQGRAAQRAEMEQYLRQGRKEEA
jgi:integrase